MKVIITFTFCCGNLWKSKFMALKKAWKTRGIFLLLCGDPDCWLNKTTTLAVEVVIVAAVAVLSAMLTLLAAAFSTNY